MWARERARAIEWVDSFHAPMGPSNHEGPDDAAGPEASRQLLYSLATAKQKCAMQRGATLVLNPPLNR